ncbi:MAG: hypothetical protein HY721_26115 [Planctomycetes bacterium]|nr:hypothetical protein [Planctomycetota bacterium]
MAVELILQNGAPVLPRWFVRNGWELQVDLEPGLNAVALVGLDRDGAPVGQDSIDVLYEPASAPFRRGDASSDGQVDIADPVRLLFHLYAGGVELTCPRSADSDDDGALGVTDAIFLLRYLFQGTAAPAEPFAACGSDATPDALGCAAFAGCGG